ncbi:hypothetical protein B0H15DRAFT_490864 [Mycena belliarum]|uniref:Uncharacterized protein n=1 Tax=Mycena belliarum TaxID=1033014 RepID=A0AAD6XQ47_9AGAR|nr:hypothetical protein B0H15DRAFT_490864 [Mycena belliae]
MLLRSFLLFIAPAIVHAQAPPTGTTVNIKDYKGNVLDLAFASAADLAPVQTLNHKSLEVAQAWVIEPAGTQFTVLNPFASTFLSFTTVANGVKPTSAQVCGHPTVNTAWTIAASKLGGFKLR